MTAARPSESTSSASAPARTTFKAVDSPGSSDHGNVCRHGQLLRGNGNLGLSARTRRQSRSQPLSKTCEASLSGTVKDTRPRKRRSAIPAGGLGPDNRIGFYVGDSWKILHNLTISPGLRYVRDTGRTDSDLPAIPALNAAFPGYGNPRATIPTRTLRPQLGIAWDPKRNGKTVIRAGAGLYLRERDL